MKNAPFVITDYSDNLTLDEGFFRPRRVNAISYPADGNDICFDLEDRSFWFMHRNGCIISLAKKYVKDTPFFDIGGGNGFVAKGLEDHGIPACLIEPGTHGCAHARKRGLSRVICSDWEGAGFKESSIPSAGLFDVIEHIEKDVDFLRQIHRSMAPGGVLLVTAPAYRFLWSNEDDVVGHFRRHTVDGLKKTLGDAGFDIVYSTYLFSFLVVPIFLFRTIPNMLGLAKSGLKKNRKEHHAGNKGIIKTILTRMVSMEMKRIKKGRAIPFGSSCLVVTRKAKNTSET